MRVYLIDGNSLLYRAFHALPQSIATSSGLPTNALYGFTSMLVKLLSDDEEVGIAVVWDGGEPKFRTEVYPEYKAHRPSTPDELKMQVGHLEEILSAMNVPTVRAEGYEADDVIATLSRKVPENVELMLVTGDQDAMQLVDGDVKVLRTTRGVTETKTYGRDEVVEEYGVTPEQIPDYKGLVGDSSDNIPGVRGVGPKGAKALLQQHDTLDELYEDLDSVSAKGTRAKLEENRESAFMSRDLARMRFDAPVEFDEGYLRFGGVSPGLREVLRRFEFRTLAQRFESLPVADGEDGEETVEAERVAVRVSAGPVEASDEPVAAVPVGMPGTLEGRRWCVAVSGEEARLADALPDRPLRLHDAKKVGVKGAVFDTYLAAYLIQPGTRSYDLEALAYELGLPEREARWEGAGSIELESEGAARRAAILYDLAPVLEEKLDELGLRDLYHDVELPLADVLARMEEIGMPADLSTIEEVGAEIEGRIAELEEEIHAEAGHPFNIGSPKQLGEVLFEEMQIPPVRKTKTGYSTDANVLQQLAVDYPIAEKITAYRELTKLRGTYIDGLKGLITPDGRIHTTLNQTTTSTGRISSDSPNLQNIPVRTELGSRIREAFTASPGRKLVVADYSQIELRILAHMSREPALVESFSGGEDVHTRTAAEVFDVRPESVTSELRRRAKMVNFGILYGISGFGLAMRLGNVHPSEAERYIKRYWERYPEVERFVARTLEEATELGYATTLFGRRRYVPELQSPNKNTRKLGERYAFNAAVQGTAADIIKVAMVDLAPRLQPLGADMLMQVHDELVFDVDEDAVDEVAALAAERMVAAYDLDPPLEVEIEVGERWGRGREWRAEV
ncbi:DNA polymerase I [Rubrobacter aplysinae]|uniref:DNA polymerase I n=1 Tax=Rubrobacter aplysinae TaxID=909625 RepID=UPI001364A149|nr:DNA polymerase I [Rubrobacter aplysinae]